MTEREALLKQIMTAFFAAKDTALFLDTHPDCRQAIADHKKYVKRLDSLKAEYNEKYGMLDAYTESAPDRWSWVDDPWPWQ